jgi:hypothetical protein
MSCVAPRLPNGALKIFLLQATPDFLTQARGFSTPFAEFKQLHQADGQGTGFGNPVVI